MKDVDTAAIEEENEAAFLKELALGLGPIDHDVNSTLT